jgi:hypothetical protein
MMTPQEEAELNLQLQQIKKMTAEQIVKALEVWIKGTKEEPNYTLQKPDADEQSKK